MFGEMEDILVEASAVAGLTSISVPCGFVDGLLLVFKLLVPKETNSKFASCRKLSKKNTFPLFPDLEKLYDHNPSHGLKST